MANITIIDEAGNKRDYDVQVVPRIEERIVLEFDASTDEPVKKYHFRVHDIVHNLSNAPEHQVLIFVMEEDESKLLQQ